MVVVTRQRADELVACLDRLECLPERPPVVVVDNASTDDTVARATGRVRVEVVRLAHNEGAAARNVGVAQARTPYVAFCDDDSAWEPGALSLACRLLDALPQVALVAARVLVGEDALDPVSELMAASPLGGPVLDSTLGAGRTRYVLGFLACAAVVRRDAFLSVGGFAEWLLIGGEEELLAADLGARGWRLLYADGLVARHRPSPTRDPAARRRLEVRNGLLIAALRRSPGVALRRAARFLADGGGKDREVRAGIVDAVRLLLSLLRRRRPIPAWLEAEFSRIEAAQAQDT